MTTLRPAERVLLAFFAYSVVASLLLGAAWKVALAGIGAAGAVWMIAAIPPHPSRSALRASPVLRDWLPLALVPVAYWQMDFIRRPGSAAAFAQRWLPVDAWLFRHAHPQTWAGPVSAALETAYVLTYAIPVAAVAILYVAGRRDRVDSFHQVFFSGTLLAYALLPFFPSASPRLVDPAGWQPPMNVMRHFNIWLLDHADIQSSVFPSGHVAAAFSATFGLFTALPERKRIAGGMLVLALLIAAATVYGRYHYAVDVVASLAITVIAWRFSAPRPRTLVVAAIAALSLTGSRAASADDVLSPSEQTAIARAFAPVLVFHRDEDFFPLNSRDGVAAGGDPESVRDRVAKYVALSQSDRLARAAVGYRVFSRVDRGAETVVVEYWCHYLYNAYTVRVGWFPYRVRDNHPEDLERLYVVLTPAAEHDAAPHDEEWARRAFRIRLIVANAHDGSVPPNQYNADIGAPITLPLTILVERGSHAMAPDVNHDGRFTPSIDSTAPGKLLWGIRDDGDAWGWYRSSYMDMRDHTAVRLCADGAAESEPRCAPYALYPVTDLQRWFDGLQLSSRERLDIVGHTSWVTRVFGDVRVENLMVPADPADGRVLDRMLTRRTRTQEGYEVGFTTVGTAAAAVAGKRFFWDVPSQRMPDIVADVSAIVPAGKRTRLQAMVTGSYALDATTNVIAGAGWFSTGRPGVDGVVGFDVRVGRFHVQPLHRLGHDWFHANLIALF
jgi:membrane-associated phospholipid phosphatase